MKISAVTDTIFLMTFPIVAAAVFGQLESLIAVAVWYVAAYTLAWLILKSTRPVLRLVKDMTQHSWRGQTVELVETR
ncbi:MAG: hypothetical protein SF029_24785 [bacterium]|nr:hypothetical protein [bacterium]